jgi:hypothetical protein
MALCRLQAVADRPAVPRSDRQAVSPYLLPSWSEPSGQCWDPLVQSDDCKCLYLELFSFFLSSLFYSFEQVPLKLLRELIHPFCITILYHNLLLFIDIYHI